MVKKIAKKGRECFQCSECKLMYKDRKLAAKCEAWCRKHKSCNIDIIRHSITGI